MQFRAQISYDDAANAFNILITVINGTTYNFLNYFILAVSGSGSTYFFLASACLAPSINPFSPPAANRAINLQLITPFYKNNSNSIIGIPFLKSIQSQVAAQSSFFNVNPIAFVSNSNTITIGVYIDNTTYLIEACLTILLFHQTAAQKDPFIAYSYSSLKLNMNSANTRTNLNAAASNNLNFPFQYGPIFEPKCFIGLQTYQLDGSIKQTFSFNISQGGVTQSYASASYNITYGYFCAAEITCPGEGMQYYPMMNDCEPICNISMCQICSSSTSCFACNIGYFINPLLRCSPCSANCASCSSAANCSLCVSGFYLNASICKVCPIYCLQCNSQVCITCQSGFLASGNQCLSCSAIMLNCLTCSAPSVCTLCITTYYFNSNAKGCVLCNATMPNCYICDLPNNCLTCYPGFYLATFNKCSPCNPRIADCCSSYVSNCSICSSNTTCATCAPTNFITADFTCSSCFIYDSRCTVCTKTKCFGCLTGYYLNENSCVNCSTVAPNCTTCQNGSACLTCGNSLLLIDGKCIDCPFWPLNDLYFLNEHNACRPCNQVVPQCQKCSSSQTCTACTSLYFLKDGTCVQCESVIPNCLTCYDEALCYICGNGYYRSPNSTDCLSCGNKIPHCGHCSINKAQGSLACEICNPEYYYNGSACVSCLAAITNCLECSGPITCIVCEKNYFLSSNQLCVNCSTILQGCSLCISNYQCSRCLAGYVLVGGFCTPCNALANKCQQCTINNSSVLCSQCMATYYLDPFFNCSSCSSLYRNCQSCTFSGCLQCISGFYVAGRDKCSPCASAIPNCIHCSNDLQCLICGSDYWLNSLKNTCDSCFELSKGCSTCQRLPVTLIVNCSECEDGFSLYASPNLILSCIQCNVTMINCVYCATPSICLNCSNTTFLNRFGTCSLCSLYIANCNLCSSSALCDECKDQYLLLPNGSCYYCNLSQFGVSMNTFLCSECQYSNGPKCNACIRGYYANPQQTSCLPCRNAIANCDACINANTCVTCSLGYQLSEISSNCVSCIIPNCGICSNGLCQQCLPGNYLLPGGVGCSSCNELIGGCSSCTASTCLACSDGYYLLAGSCVTCSSVIPNCLLCSDGQTCILKHTFAPPPQESPLTKPFAIITLALAAVLLIGLIIWWKLTQHQETFILHEEGKLDTDRRITNDEVYSNEIALEKGKICQQCRTNPPQVMRLELLCSRCERILNRGHKHKIRKAIRQKGQNKGDLPPIDEEQEIGLQLESKMEGNSKQSSNKQQIIRNDESLSKKAQTKTTNDAESIALRNLF